MNILVIMEDALRPRNMSCHGYAKPTTPNCDRLAAEGVRFENCISVSAHTMPPIVSMLTGEYPATHGLVSEQDYARWMSGNLWRNRRTPLHALAESGYAVDGELVMRWAPLGFTRDRNDVLAYLENNREERWFYFAEPYPTHLPYNPPREYYDLFVDEGFNPSPETLERMDVVKTKLICHPGDVVAAMEVGQEDAIGDIGDGVHDRSSGVVELQPEDEPGIRALYDGETRVFDDLVGRILSKLEDLGTLDDTLVVITSDHGEELLERGHVGHTSANLKGTLHDESIHVPLIMRYPGKIPSGTVISNQVSQVDLIPTIFALADLPFDFDVSGRSLVPLILGESDRFREETYAETPPAGWQALHGDERRLYCIRTSQWKLIARTDRPGAPPGYELYDILEDPGERQDVYGTRSSQAAELKTRLDTYIATGH